MNHHCFNGGLNPKDSFCFFNNVLGQSAEANIPSQIAGCTSLPLKVYVSGPHMFRLVS